MPTLLISSRQSEDNQALWRAAVRRGWSAERVRGIRLPEGIEDEEIVIYVESLFASVVADKLGLRLIAPEEDWLVNLPAEYRKRDIRLSTLGEARTLQERAFVKPPNEKSFEAKVYGSGAELPDDYEDTTAVLIAEPVEFEVEYRCFVLDQEVRTLSPYLRHGQLAQTEGYMAPEDEVHEARKFAETVLQDSRVTLPRSVAVDVGRMTGQGWAVVEANPSWSSGIYGCDTEEVLEVIRYAVG